MIYVICATCLFGLALVLVKLSAQRISPFLGNVLFTIATLATQLIMLFIAYSRGVVINRTPAGIKLSLAGGVVVGLYTIFLFYSFLNIGVVKTSPIVYAGAICIASFLSIAFLGEAVTSTNIAGIVLIIVGIVLLLFK